MDNWSHEIRRLLSKNNKATLIWMDLHPDTAREVLLILDRSGLYVGDLLDTIQPLCHSSFVNPHPELGLKTNEQLEFIGDKVMNLAAAHIIFSNYPDLSEGDLTKRVSYLTNNETLAKFALIVGLDKLVLMGENMLADLKNGRKVDSVYADVFEAMIGALYFAKGFDRVKDALNKIYNLSVASGFDPLYNPDLSDPISEFNELCQKTLKVNPIFKLIRTISNNPTKLEMSAQILGKSVARGIFNSMKEGKIALSKEMLANNVIDKFKKT